MVVKPQLCLLCSMSIYQQFLFKTYNVNQQVHHLAKQLKPNYYMSNRYKLPNKEPET